ncbi:hypothetical protein F4815DRAFT_441528 [Daldinia loculata]|nr:hypothetical protein F4815DRAFT_441528 [Daldinia loculata]
MTDHHPLSSDDFYKVVGILSLVIVHTFLVSALFLAAPYVPDYRGGDIVAIFSSAFLLPITGFLSCTLRFTDSDDIGKAVQVLFAAWVGFLAATSLWIYTLATAYWLGAAPGMSARKFVRTLAWTFV